jgi:inner membrane protein
MATVLSHAVAAVALGVVCRRKIPGRAIFYGAVSSMVPDLDVLGFGLGIRYGDPFGHRGFTHSLFFAALWAAFVTVVLFLKPADRSRWPAIWFFLFLATASHGLLDAMTDGGLGVAFFAPFDNTRFFLPWRPISVSPIGARFFSPRGMAVMMSEALWIWLPSIAIAGAARLYTRRKIPRT